MEKPLDAPPDWTPPSPAEMVCGTCGGDGGEEAKCPTCLGTGHTQVQGCPMAMVSSDVWNAMEGQRRYRHGKLLPVAGGWLEQTRVFLDALDVIESLEPEPVPRGRGEE